jgi:hypothetical protein
MAGGAPEGKGDPGASGSGSGSGEGDTGEQQSGEVQVQQQQEQQVSVTGGDMYSVGFISRETSQKLPVCTIP